jgi:RNA polymerase sigma-70 factor (ECF subfamily)
MTAALFHSWYFAQSSSGDPAGRSHDRASRRGAAHTAAHTATPAAATSRPAFDITPELVERVRARDVSAFDTLVRLAFEPLVRFAYSFVRAQDVAEDVVQDVLAQVWQRGDVWCPTGAAAAYLLATVRNEALKILRHRGVEMRHEARVQSEWVPDATTSRLLTPDELLVWRERMRAFEAVLNSLTERQRTAFVLRYEQELTVPAIATVLGMSTKGAEKLVSRVTHVLRERLRDIR